MLDSEQVTLPVLMVVLLNSALAWAPAAYRARQGISGRLPFAFSLLFAAVALAAQSAGRLQLLLGVANGLAAARDVALSLARLLLVFALHRAVRRLKLRSHKFVAYTLLLSLFLDAVLLKTMHSLQLDPLRRQLRALPMTQHELAVLVTHKHPSAESMGFSISTSGPEYAKLVSVGADVLRAVAAHSHVGAFNLTVSLVRDDETLNAFATPPGHLFFFSRMVANTTKDELACVIGHEATHVLFMHSAESIFLTGFLGDLLDDITCITTGLTCSLESAGFFRDGFVGDVRSWALESPLSQEREFEADLFGMYFAALAGYDAGRCAALHEPGGLLHDKDSAGNTSVPLTAALNSWSRSHPYAPLRAAFLRSWLDDGGSSDDSGKDKKKAKGKAAPAMPRGVSPATWRSKPTLDASLGKLALTPVLAPGPHFLTRELQLLVCGHAALVLAAITLLARTPSALAAATGAGGLRPTASIVELDALWQQLGAALHTALRRLPTFVLIAPAVLEMAGDAYRDAKRKYKLLFPAALVIGLFSWLALDVVLTAGRVVHRAAARALRARRRAAAAKLPAAVAPVADEAAAAAPSETPTHAQAEAMVREELRTNAFNSATGGAPQLAPVRSISAHEAAQ
jgi:Zn-dependent protease with chaperone function